MVNAIEPTAIQAFAGTRKTRKAERGIPETGKKRRKTTNEEKKLGNIPRERNRVFRRTRLDFRRRLPINALKGGRRRLNKLESLRKTLIQTRKQLNEVSEQKRALLWNLRGRNITKEQYDEQYQRLIKQQNELTSKLEQLEFQLLLEQLKAQLESNKFITIYFRSLRGIGKPSQPRLLGTELSLPCGHKLNLLSYLTNLQKTEKTRTRARLLLSRLYDSIIEIQHLETTAGVREFLILCPSCGEQYAMVLELKPIPKAT